MSSDVPFSVSLRSGFYYSRFDSLLKTPLSPIHQQTAQEYDDVNKEDQCRDSSPRNRDKSRNIEQDILNRWEGKKVVLLSSLEIPGITDRPETLLFDWEDFEIAGGLDKLSETIAKRQQFEAERDQITADTSRQDVERILGCSARQANRVLNKLRGGNIPHVPFREQILTLLSDSEKKASDIVATIEGHPQAIHKELARLIKTGEIVKVRWGIYTLPKTSSPTE